MSLPTLCLAAHCPENELVSCFHGDFRVPPGRQCLLASGRRQCGAPSALHHIGVVGVAGWRLAAYAHGRELRDNASGKNTVTSRHFRIKVYVENGMPLVRNAGGDVVPLRQFLTEHQVKYDCLIGFGDEGRVPIKAYVLVRSWRGARVFIEVFDLVKALGADEKKSQKGKQFVLNMHVVWQASLASRGVPPQHIRKARPRSSCPQVGCDPGHPYEERIFDEAVISFLGVVVVLARYWEAKVRKASEAAKAAALLAAMFTNYLPQEWVISVVLAPSWPIPWGGREGHGWEDYQCVATVLTLPVTSGIVDMSSLLAHREGAPLSGACSKLCAAFGNAAAVDLLEFLKVVWLASGLLWLCRQLFWHLHIAMEHGFIQRPGIVDPLCSPRHRGPMGSRHDQAVLQAVVARRRADFQREAATSDTRPRPTSNLTRESRQFRRGEEVFLKRYLASAREVFSATRHSHLAADSSRVGGKNTEFVAVWSVEGQRAAWCPPQVFRGPPLGQHSWGVQKRDLLKQRGGI